MTKNYQKSCFLPKNAGFTLIELLVVVLIIGILSAVALPQYNRAVLKSRFSEAQMLARVFAESGARYYLANGTPPYYWKDMDIGIPNSCHASDLSVEGYMNCHGNRITCDLLMGGAQVIVCFTGMKSAGVYQVAYAQFFSSDAQGRQCWASPEDKDANALCKSLGGTLSGLETHTHCPERRCNRYLLP